MKCQTFISLSASVLSGFDIDNDYYRIGLTAAESN